MTNILKALDNLFYLCLKVPRVLVTNIYFSILYIVACHLQGAPREYGGVRTFGGFMIGLNSHDALKPTV